MYFVYSWLTKTTSSDGHGTSTVPSVLLQEIICSIQCKGKYLYLQLFSLSHSYSFLGGTNEPFYLCLQRVAASCVWLAGKLEESPRKSKHIIFVFHRMECRRENLPIEFLDVLSKVYFVQLNIISVSFLVKRLHTIWLDFLSWRKLESLLLWFSHFFVGVS